MTGDAQRPEQAPSPAPEASFRTDKIIVEKKGAVGWLVFNNPERRNAVSLEMWQAIGPAFEDFASDPDVRVVVMRGAGGKAFVSGADISDFDKHRTSAKESAEYAKLPDLGKEKMSRLGKPLIAMIEGYCLGGGLTIALRADIRIAASTAQFGVPAAKLGIAYAVDSLSRLVALVGPAKAKELMFTAERIPAAEALRIGLVNRVVEPDAIEQAVDEFTETIVSNAPLAIRASKAAIDEIVKGPANVDLAMLKALSDACMDSADYSEGRRAFQEKRKPQFKGL